jgi:hypothetical protein
MVVMLERLEKRPRATLVLFSPPIFAGTTSIYVFRVSPPPPLRNAEGFFIYEFLGQPEHQETKMDEIGVSRFK